MEAQPPYTFNNYCDKCGLPKTYTGDTTNIILCSCEEKKSSGITGWKCPVCGAGVSPFTTQCPCNRRMTY